MKLLLLLTSHRQLEEFSIFATLLKKLCPRFSESSDLFVHCNHSEISSNLLTFFQDFPQKNKQLLVTTKNTGFNLGGIEAVEDVYQKSGFKGYDWVIHCHPDVFMLHETIVLKHLEEHLSKPTQFLITKSRRDPTYFSFDWFAFKPSAWTTNLFEGWQSWDNYPEFYLHHVITTRDIPYVFIPRFDNDCWEPRRPDEYLGLWHEHDLARVKEFMKTFKLAD